MVDEDAGEIAADGLVEQRGANRRVYTAREAEYHAVVAYLLAQLVDRCLHKRGRTPLLAAVADVNHEIPQQRLALRGVEHLGVELHGPEGVARAGVGGEAHIVGAGDDVAVLRNGGDGVAMAHPHLRVGFKVLEEGIGEVDGA